MLLFILVKFHFVNEIYLSILYFQVWPTVDRENSNYSAAYSFVLHSYYFILSLSGMSWICPISVAYLWDIKAKDNKHSSDCCRRRSVLQNYQEISGNIRYNVANSYRWPSNGNLVWMSLNHFLWALLIKKSRDPVLTKISRTTVPYENNTNYFGETQGARKLGENILRIKCN